MTGAPLLAHSILGTNRLYPVQFASGSSSSLAILVNLAGVEHVVKLDSSVSPCNLSKVVSYPPLPSVANLDSPVAASTKQCNVLPFDDDNDSSTSSAPLREPNHPSVPLDVVPSLALPPTESEPLSVELSPSIVDVSVAQRVKRRAITPLSLSKTEILRANEVESIHLYYGCPSDKSLG